MSNVSRKLKLAFALCLILASTAVSFAATMDSYDQRSYAQPRAMRMAGSAGAGPSAINGDSTDEEFHHERPERNR